jgi:hypothetical protein
MKSIMVVAACTGRAKVYLHSVDEEI